MSERFEDNDFLAGYVYDAKGYHTPPIYLANNPLNIAKFIVRGITSPQVQIVNGADWEEFAIEDGKLYCKDKEYFNESIQPLLDKMSTGYINPFEGAIEFNYTPRTFSDSKEQFITWVSEKFNYELGGI